MLLLLPQRLLLLLLLRICAPLGHHVLRSMLMAAVLICVGEG